jgi:IS6 family transposase
MAARAMLRWSRPPVCEETEQLINTGSASSAPAGYRFPREVIAVAVRWYLRYGLSYRDVEELLAERGVEVDHVTVYRWVQTFTPEFIDAARLARHATGSSWFVDETYVKVAGRWTYLYRAVDEYGQVIDVLVSTRRDAAATRAFLARARRYGSASVEITTDRAPVYPRVVDEVPGGSTRHRAVRHQPDRSRSRPAQSPAAADARTQAAGLGAHDRGRPFVHPEPAPRPLRDHRRSTSPRPRPRPRPRRVRRTRRDHLSRRTRSPRQTSHTSAPATQQRPRQPFRQSPRPADRQDAGPCSPARTQGETRSASGRCWLHGPQRKCTDRSCRR